MDESLHDLALLITFDYYLTFKDQQVASLVCKHWNNLLNESCYGDKKVLHIRKRLKVDSYLWNLLITSTQKYKHLKISVEDFYFDFIAMKECFERIGKNVLSININTIPKTMNGFYLPENLFPRLVKIYFEDLNIFHLQGIPRTVRHIHCNRIDRQSTFEIRTAMQCRLNFRTISADRICVATGTLPSYEIAYDIFELSPSLSGLGVFGPTTNEIEIMSSVNFREIVTVKPEHVMGFVDASALPRDDVTAYIRKLQQLPNLRKPPSFTATNGCFFCHERIPLKKVTTVTIIGAKSNHYCVSCLENLGQSCPGLKVIRIMEDHKRVFKFLKPILPKSLQLVIEKRVLYLKDCKVPKLNEMVEIQVAFKYSSKEVEFFLAELKREFEALRPLYRRAKHGRKIVNWIQKFYFGQI